LPTLFFSDKDVINRMNKEKNTLIQGIDTIIIRVSDIESSKAWYQDSLEFTSVWQDVDMKLVVLDTNGAASITLWQTDKKIESHKDTATHPIFKTTDASKLGEDLHNKGVQVEPVIQDEHVKYFFFYDPDGNILEACEILG
jgi:catechol 2,3-dioxygenase-like lactoylglutathione lyase family enzyme